MSFRLWFYLGKCVPGFFVLIACSWLLGAPGSTLRVIGDAAVAVLILLGLTGAVMGVLLALGRLRMRCPFCGKPSEVGGNKREGMFLVCECCGVVHGAGFCGLRLVREPLEEEDA